MIFSLDHTLSLTSVYSGLKIFLNLPYFFKKIQTTLNPNLPWRVIPWTEISISLILLTKLRVVGYSPTQPTPFILTQPQWQLETVQRSMSLWTKESSIKYKIRIVIYNIFRTSIVIQIHILFKLDFRSSNFASSLKIKPALRGVIFHKSFI